MNNTESLQDVNVGDSVITKRSGMGSRYQLYKKAVTKVTATQIVVGDVRYNRETGKRLGENGDRWSSHEYLYALTPELEAEYSRQENLEYVKSVVFYKLDDATIQAVVDVLKKGGTQA